MTNIEDVKNYKKTGFKRFVCYVCLPQDELLIINKEKNPDLYKSFGNRDYVAVEELKNLDDAYVDKIARLVYLKKLKTVERFNMDKTAELIIVNPLGCYDTISVVDVIKNFTTEDNKALTLDTLLSEGWHKVVFNPKAIPYNFGACFVPKEQTGSLCDMVYNDKSMNHGKGDFICCKMTKDGKFDMTKRFVVNGLHFAMCYNIRGFEDCVVDSKLLGKYKQTALPDICYKDESNKPENVEKCNSLLQGYFKTLRNCFLNTGEYKSYESYKNFKASLMKVSDKKVLDKFMTEPKVRKMMETSGIYALKDALYDALSQDEEKYSDLAHQLDKNMNNLVSKILKSYKVADFKQVMQCNNKKVEIYYAYVPVTIESIPKCIIFKVQPDTGKGAVVVITDAILSKQALALASCYYEISVSSSLVGDK